MAVEIERKFLVTRNPWILCSTPKSRIIQGYLSTKPDSTVRIRHELKDNLNFGYITIKGRNKNNSSSRPEFEYPIHPEDATIMLLTMCNDLVLYKTRWFIEHNGHEWHVDEFSRDNQGLVTAEIELTSEDELWDKPDWLGEEITHDNRYANSSLILNPWTTW